MTCAAMSPMASSADVLALLSDDCRREVPALVATSWQAVLPLIKQDPLPRLHAQLGETRV